MGIIGNVVESEVRHVTGMRMLVNERSYLPASYLRAFSDGDSQRSFGGAQH